MHDWKVHDAAVVWCISNLKTLSQLGLLNDPLYARSHTWERVVTTYILVTYAWAFVLFAHVIRLTLVECILILECKCAHRWIWTKKLSRLTEGTHIWMRCLPISCMSTFPNTLSRSHSISTLERTLWTVFVCLSTSLLGCQHVQFSRYFQ